MRHRGFLRALKVRLRIMGVRWIVREDRRFRSSGSVGNIVPGLLYGGLPRLPWL
ncbi:hypothetical protein HN018_00570 [Lichenicola cladoniae]|uniref:Uncharacterized protein n=1 Tax=Lichenicola cladoniae TaxID=1484109 RepID=A0A6M8HL20_9PROT|nr:hypothetical protein [Lichenicola cladoniae]NPD65139.1 hypothetical protein [Acetobacteraceae bacterium]QKE88745.1 hypothetical protein HN018_00570 [Lichenicola cladoniae]